MKYAFGPYEIDTEAMELTGDGQVIAVQPQVFALLVFLIENRDRVVTKDEIIGAVWDGRIVSDGTLNARINALRTALGDSGTRQGVIKTHPRQGFRFVADLNSGAEDTGRPADRRTIAVLPFVNISGDPEQIYFADGLTEDLITDLSKIPDLFVIARNSSFAFRDSPKNLTDIGQELGVAHILEGSVRKAGERIRINAQLLDTATGGHIWADRFDGTIADIFDVQDEITDKIISALKVSLAAAPGIGRQTNSIEAYELSLRGRAKFFMFSPETNRECINLLDQAVAADPDFATAWADQVFPYQSGWSFTWEGYDNGLDVAAGKAEKAFALDPTSSFVNSRLAWVRTFQGRHDEAMTTFERARTLDPNNVEALTWYCEALNYAGDPEQALEIGAASLKHDPLPPPNCLHHIGHAHFLLGNLEKALDYGSRALRMAPSFPAANIVMAAINWEAGNAAEARELVTNMTLSNPRLTFARFYDRYPYARPEHKDRVANAIREAGLQ